MSVRIGIMGFGRLGRNMFRIGRATGTQRRPRGQGAQAG